LVGARGFGSCSFAGLGIVNAIGSKGFGAAATLGLRCCVRVEVLEGVWEGWVETRGVKRLVETSILKAIARVVEEHFPVRVRGLRVEGFSEIPYASGLKGSSALINAVLAGLLDRLGIRVSVYELALLGVEAAKKAQLTITGALDDHLAVSGCGGYATINPHKLAYHDPSLQGWVGLLVRGEKPIKSVKVEKFTLYQNIYQIAWKLAVIGQWWNAATVNGIASLLAYREPVEPLIEALNVDNILGGGVSGKGPTIYVVGIEEKAVEEALDLLAKAYGGEKIVTKIVACKNNSHKPTEQTITKTFNTIKPNTI